MFDLEMETLTETVPVQINSKSINNSTSSNTELNNNVEDNNASDHSSKTSVGWTEDGEITEYKYLEELSSLKKMQRDSQSEISAAHFTVKANVEPEPSDSLDSLPLLMLDGNKKESTISDEFLKAEIAVNGNQIERKLSSVSEDSRNSDIEEPASTFSKARISTPKLEDMPIRQESNRSISASSTNSGSSESLSVDNEFCTLRDEIKHNIRTSLESTVEATRRSLQDQKDNELLPSVDEKKLNDRSRSHSISDASTDSKNEEIDTFPSLSDTTLEELGLLRSDVFESDSPGLDEIERKYQVLTLAFATDTMTLQMRHERLRRLRDQAEDNLATEIARLDNGIRRLKPLCIDAERTELVSSLLTQIDVLIQASSRVSTSSETYGAVQQEWRLSDAMNLIINFVESLKQQRDTAKRQLQCTKRMLQDSTTVEGVKATNIRQKASSASHNNNTSNRLIARRRASIAAISRPLGSTEPPKPFTRNQLPTSLNLESLSRRSKLPERLSPSRASLSPRSDHNGEILQHISEYTENAEGSPEHESRRESCESHSTEVLLIGNTLMRRVSLRICNLFRRFVGDEFLGQGTFNEICCTGALLCFAIAIMILANTMLEYFMMRNNRIVQRIPWNWCSWEEIFRPFVQKNYNNGPPPI